jgi:DNA-binding response OmpR family regulator
MIRNNNRQPTRVLVVEDEYLIAADLVMRLEGEGVEVIGPVGTIEGALDLLDRTEILDGAVLDLSLSGEMAFPVADALRDRGVPFVFSTGYDRTRIPTRYAGVTRLDKPTNAMMVLNALIG